MRVLLWLAVVAFVLAVVAAYARAGSPLARVPWVPVGLALWVLAVLVDVGAFDFD